MSARISLYPACFLLACATLPVSALAQDSGDAVAAASGLPSAGGGPAGWRNQWGVGVIANPEFVGSDDYTVLPIPYLDFRYFDARGTLFFANVAQGIGAYAYRYRNKETGTFFNAAAAIAYGFNVRDDSIDGLEEVDGATEARLYLEAGGESWVASATVAQDVGSGHEGAYLDLSASWRGSLGTRGGFFALGPVLRFGDDDYSSALFSVSTSESAASGLPEFTASAGAERAGLQGLLSLPVGNSKWRWTGILRASHLLGDASDSPIIEDNMQLFFLAAFTRPF